MVVYLDCNATTPLEPEVRATMLEFFDEEYGNAGSRTHEFGNRAKKAVQKARDQVAAVVSAKRDEVVFTSGATESNNLALLGLAAHGESVGRRHFVSTAIEHTAVMEPLKALVQRGFEVTFVPPTSGGWVDPDAIHAALRGDTLAVSVMHVNNETGVVQPVSSIAAALEDHEAFFHVDAAQGFGKDIESLTFERIDMLSVSAHKIYGPKGVGALITRRRGFERPPLQPLVFGGGQERGLRPGTLPVPLIVGLGKTAELAAGSCEARSAACARYRSGVVSALQRLDVVVNGDASRVMPHVLNVSIPGLDSEAVMVALKDLVAVSNGSACTSQKYEPSHVLKAMGLSDDRIDGALRISWCHMTPEVDWAEVAARLAELR